MKKVLNIFAFAVIAILSFNIATAQDYNVQTNALEKIGVDLRCDISKQPEDCFPIMIERVVTIPKYPNCKITVTAHYTVCNGKRYVQIISYSFADNGCDKLKKKYLEENRKLSEYYKWFDNQLLYALMKDLFMEAFKIKPEPGYICPEKKAIYIGLMVPCEAYWIYWTNYNPLCPECSCPENYRVVKTRCSTMSCCEYEVELCYDPETEEVQIQGEDTGVPVYDDCANGYTNPPLFFVPLGYTCKLLFNTPCVATCDNIYLYNSPEPTGK